MLAIEVAQIKGCFAAKFRHQVSPPSFVAKFRHQVSPGSFVSFSLISDFSLEIGPRRLDDPFLRGDGAGSVKTPTNNRLLILKMFYF